MSRTKGGITSKVHTLDCAKFVLNFAQIDQNQWKELYHTESCKLLTELDKARNQTKDQSVSKSPIRHLITQRSSVQIRPPQPTFSPLFQPHTAVSVQTSALARAAMDCSPRVRRNGLAHLAPDGW
jgi:hypothetical protein